MTDVLDVPALQREIGEINRANGWRESALPFDQAMMLLVTEMSEAVDAWRKWGFKDQTRDGPVEMGNPPDGPPKPEGVGSEFADISIRLLDDCVIYGVKLDERLHQLETRQFAGTLPSAMWSMTREAVRADGAYRLGDSAMVARQFTVLWLQLNHFSAQFGVDLPAEITRKMAYNRTRGWKHGGKRI